MIVLRKRIKLIADGKHFNPVLLGKYGIMANKIFIAGEKLIWISWLKIALSFNAWPPILRRQVRREINFQAPRAGFSHECYKIAVTYRRVNPTRRSSEFTRVNRRYVIPAVVRCNEPDWDEIHPIPAKLLYFVIGSLDRLDKIPFSIRNAATAARADIETFLKIILSDLL